MSRAPPTGKTTNHEQRNRRWLPFPRDFGFGFPDELGVLYQTASGRNVEAPPPSYAALAKELPQRLVLDVGHKRIADESTGLILLGMEAVNLSRHSLGAPRVRKVRFNDPYFRLFPC